MKWNTPITRQDVKSGQVEFILPPDRPFQRHLGLQILTPNVRMVNQYSLDGNSYILLAIDANHPPANVEYFLDIEFDPQPINACVYAAQWDLSNDNPRQYLGITHHTSAKIDPSHPRIKHILDKEILRGRTDLDDLDKARAIATWVGHIPYEMITAGMSWPTLEQYFASNFRYLECGGHAIFFVMLSRAAGIPARRLFHPWLTDRPTDKFDSHCIAEFYTPKLGWIPVDCTTAFSDKNPTQWMRTPMSCPTTWPTGLSLTVESMSGKELKMINAARTNTLQKCEITYIS
eukprot:gene16753-19919_t